jgi:hypothetical protein
MMEAVELRFAYCRKARAGLRNALSPLRLGGNWENLVEKSHTRIQALA